MSSYDLPSEFKCDSEQGGHVSGAVSSNDLIVITIRDDDSREEGYIELADRHVRDFFEGFSALLLGNEERVRVDVGDKDRDRDAESIILSHGGGGVSFELVLWGDPAEDDATAAFSVWLSDLAAHSVYVGLNATGLRQGAAYR